jgi:cytochrome b pre-mRNA-processing protein 3
MGIGDLAIPKEMQRMGEAFYGRAQAYKMALAASAPDALAEALKRNIYGGEPPTPAAPVRLAAYMREAVRVLKTQPAAGFLAGALDLPDPVAVIV